MSLTVEALYDRLRNPGRKRGGTDIDVPADQRDYWDELLTLSTELVERYAPGCPDNVHNAAASRVAAYWFRSEPTTNTEHEGTAARRPAGVLRHSGAAAIMQPWKVRRAL